MRRMLAALLLGGLVSLVACSDDTEQTEIVLTFDLESIERRLQRVGPDDSILYGWNHLRATADYDGEPIAVELQAGVEYTNGAGPCDGLFTLTFPDESILALAFVDCQSYTASEVSGARFASRLRIIGGTGEFVDVRGSGEYTGERREEIGGAVRSRMVLRVTG